ncbi:MAG: patatin-like protein [Alphaproteobacteria bacterium]|jgi:patatin-related protein|nr:patatin-like protein [Alphaproteobacteria bacterium]
MREKELRLALVCYGGVSLAVYMHGVSKEILKLVRASARYQAEGEPPDRPANGDQPDTERVYLDLLQTIGAELDMRVVVDVIAGASAGGINGIQLARALALDLAFDPLREMWLDKADVTELLAPERRARTWSKWFLRPLLHWGLSQRQLAHLAPDEEMREKLSLFIRSRWFRPPFGGPALCRALYEAMAAMGEPAERPGTLLPGGQWLDLYVTLTDFFGYAQHIPLHDPPRITEREHRHILHFRHRHFSDGTTTTDFDDDNLPSLLFAARATSSFPGAFPPTRIAEIDGQLARMGAAWRNRERFLRRNFLPYASAGQDPEATAFIDGSVLNNKPFAQAIESIKLRPAYRQVDRRLVYIDPDPERPDPVGIRRAPGLLTTLKGALSDLPRNEPIRDELAWINGYNLRVRRLKTLLDDSEPRIERLVAEIVGDDFDQRPDSGDLAAWRLAADAQAAARSGFAHDGYLRLRIDATCDQLAAILARAGGAPLDEGRTQSLASRLRAWAQGAGIYPDPKASTGNEASTEFLRGLDLDYRARRLRFVVRGLNQMYARLRQPEFTGEGPIGIELDAIKGSIYDVLERLRRFGDASFLTAQARALAGDALAERHVDFAELLRLTAADLRLDEIGRAIDEILGLTALAKLPRAAQRELQTSFLGFAFWDVLAFTVTSWRDVGEFDEIRVDRISPDDANGIRGGGASEILKGVGLGHFAAFFSRRHRENDYLWGRLHAAERLIDIVVDCARLEGAAEDLDPTAVKRRAFLTILDAEAPQLGLSGGLIDDLRREIGGGMGQ